MRKIACVLFLFICTKYSVFTQNTPKQLAPVLERLITLNEKDKAISEVLNAISKQAFVTFTYSQLFDEKQKITIKCQKKPLRLVLSELLSFGACNYKLKDQYIIINCSKKNNPPPAVVKGYVYSALDGNPLNSASVYIKQFARATITDNFGFFKLSFPKKYSTIQLSFAKEKFNDTLLVLNQPNQNELIVFLHPHLKNLPINDADSIPLKKDSSRVDTTIKNSVVLGNKTATDSLREKKASSASAKHSKGIHSKKMLVLKSNARNIREIFRKPFSFSFFPGIGSNSMLSSNTINKYSINLFGGFSKEIELMEIGGLINIVKGNVKKIQLAGLANFVEGHSRGLQFAGIFNKSKSIKGIQIAGLANVTEENKGLQISGLLNRSKQVNKGLQLSGIANISDENNGAQVSLLFNKCKINNGFQFSLINVSDSSRGFPIGLISIVKNGYHKLEIAFDDLFLTTLNFRTGMPYFHNLLFAGLSTTNPQYYTLGYGIGSTFRLKGKWNVNFELSTQLIESFKYEGMYLSLINKFYTGIEYTVNSKFRVGLGPTLNFLYFNADSPAIPFIPESETKYRTITNTNTTNQTTVSGQTTATVNTTTTETSYFALPRQTKRIGFKISFKFL